MLHKECFDVYVARAGVEANDLAPALAALEPLLADTATVRRFRGRLHFFLSGYDDDPRELYEIPEVKPYLRALDAKFPYWFWFLEPADPAILLLVACLAEPAEYGSHGSKVSLTIMPAALAPFLQRQMRALEQLARRFELDVNECLPVVYAYFRHFRVPEAVAHHTSRLN